MNKTQVIRRLARPHTIASRCAYAMLSVLSTTAASVAFMSIAQADTYSPQDTTPSVAITQSVDNELAQVRLNIRQSNAIVGDLQTQLDIVNGRMIARGRAYYRLKHAGLLPLGSGFDALLDHTSKVERLRRAIERDANVAVALRDETAVQIDRRNGLVDRQVSLELKLQAVGEAHAALMESVDRHWAYERAFGSSRETAGEDYSAVYGGATQPPIGPSADAARESPGGFRSLRGRLPFPIAGRTEVRSVHRPGASGPGVELTATEGSAVVAVYAGRVAFADEYDPFGRVVILDHGDGYITMSGELGSIDVRVGEEVSAGARIGTVGRVEGRGKAVLYFELRLSDNALDPLLWFGL